MRGGKQADRSHKTGNRTDAAVSLHKANPEIYLTDATFNNGGWIAGLLWQAGWRPFAVDGTKIRVTINDAAAKKWRLLTSSFINSTMRPFTRSSRWP